VALKNRSDDKRLGIFLFDRQSSKVNQELQCQKRRKPIPCRNRSDSIWPWIKPLRSTMVIRGARSGRAVAARTGGALYR
jgi:hypothetical protein